MSITPWIYNGCCPHPVSKVSVTQNYFPITGPDQKAVVSVFEEVVEDDNKVFLPYEPLRGFDITVYINGLLQPIELQVDGLKLVFPHQLVGDAVQIHYAHLIPEPTP